MTMRQFPIYSFNMKWTEDDGGRRDNSSGADVMFREHPDTEELDKIAQKRWDAMKGKESVRNPSEPIIEIKHQWDEEWCLTWFSHYTFDDGQSDADLMSSFASFVDRTRTYNRNNQRKSNGFFYDPRCLMGAEDVWRWHGGDGGAPCRCEHCKKAGVVRVDH